MHLNAFLIVLFYFVTSVNCNLEVRLLHVLFRHGDKVPHRFYQNYPNDPYRDYSYYPMGDGDLTNEGKMREYKIGRMLRERYDGYFGADYWPDKIYGLATDVPRTQLSIQLVLAGLFPPSEKQTWNPHLPWIPTWTPLSIPSDMQNLLYPHYCPRYKEEYARFIAQDEIQDMIKKYKNVFSYLTDHSGKVINTTTGVQFMYNLLKEEAAQNLTLPKWTENVFPSPMKEITVLDFNLHSYTRTLKRLNGGMLLKKIIEDIELYQKGKLTPADRKAFLFSAHEVNVAALARALGTNEPLLPAYGSTIILETLRDKKGTYYIRVLLWTGVSEKLIIQTIPGCNELCPYNEFRKLMNDVIPTEEESSCRRKDHHHYHISSSTKNTVDKFVFCLLTISYVILESLT
ncbi:PREDICTED: venom acid phosphatase Acph-1-like [Polistes dominula]|uniref:acid phosphatase n=1 Tax=Polistes dominula TaxID=743375 RepID=A0ABM1IBK3_POLDO|nr:PREDICTED: venom acid phosphatase Acph-1-like [Polistes dominula]